ncbi:GFA family protein [Sphingomonas sp. SRS2]|uniref:GFA family protein n=1 Tax=Sphingomonas sp. SRS2 TaxID=133190 RepID=UPI000618418A|nr:aldehyde-activating protein [Sphingomonas sp. SRS2]KKC23939.1 aldehyde-activating protein [Sphingomonas sp. SRS2]
MINLSCLCGQIRVEVAKRPDFIHECNCLLCSKTGARWGYFHPSEVAIDGATKGYCRADKEEPAAEIRFCETCGSTTHFSLTTSAVAKFGDTMMGVNMLLADEADLAGVELRFPDGRAWAGAGDFAYLREARIIGAAALPG